MANLNNAEKESFAAQVAGVLAEAETAAALKAKNFDPGQLAAAISGGIISLGELNADTLAKKNAYEKALKLENETRDAAYTSASGGVDTVEGLLGKANPIAQKLRAIRGTMSPVRGKKSAAKPDA